MSELAGFTIATGTNPPVLNTVLMTLAWIVNLAVAEAAIRRSTLSARRRSS
ncbi:hypothetical protein [Xylanimonas sp. McL0601]|uniref:hypothetical protein n=1 Tax=Xylanimonas sp. McL0601 TaxID=3414739 RepID=UPI003CF2495B